MKPVASGRCAHCVTFGPGPSSAQTVKSIRDLYCEFLAEIQAEAGGAEAEAASPPARAPEPELPAGNAGKALRSVAAAEAAAAEEGAADIEKTLSLAEVRRLGGPDGVLRNTLTGLSGVEEVASARGTSARVPAIPLDEPISSALLARVASIARLFVHMVVNEAAKGSLPLHGLEQWCKAPHTYAPLAKHADGSVTQNALQPPTGTRWRCTPLSMPPLLLHSREVPWHKAEVLRFAAAFAKMGKDFALIGSSVGSRTVQQTVSFYYGPWRATPFYKRYVEAKLAKTEQQLHDEWHAYRSRAWFHFWRFDDTALTEQELASGVLQLVSDADASRASTKRAHSAGGSTTALVPSTSSTSSALVDAKFNMPVMLLTDPLYVDVSEEGAGEVQGQQQQEGKQAAGAGSDNGSPDTPLLTAPEPPRTQSWEEVVGGSQGGSAVQGSEGANRASTCEDAPSAAIEQASQSDADGGQGGRNAEVCQQQAPSAIEAGAALPTSETSSPPAADDCKTQADEPAASPSDLAGSSQGHNDGEDGIMKGSGEGRPFPGFVEDIVKTLKAVGVPCAAAGTVELSPKDSSLKQPDDTHAQDAEQEVPLGAVLVGSVRRSTRRRHSRGAKGRGKPSTRSGQRRRSKSGTGAQGDSGSDDEQPSVSLLETLDRQHAEMAHASRKRLAGAVSWTKDRDIDNEPFCALCGDGGDLVCCDGDCRRSYHLGCITRANLMIKAVIRDNPSLASDALLSRLLDIDKDHWTCLNCVTNVHDCFLCGNPGVAGVEVFRCQRMCGKHYHLECLAADPRTQWFSPPNTDLTIQNAGGRGKPSPHPAFSCPFHLCSECGAPFDAFKPRTTVYRCQACPTAYHACCLPKDARLDVNEVVTCAHSAAHATKRFDAQYHTGTSLFVDAPPKESAATPAPAKPSKAAAAAKAAAVAATEVPTTGDEAVDAEASAEAESARAASHADMLAALRPNTVPWWYAATTPHSPAEFTYEQAAVAALATAVALVSGAGFRSNGSAVAASPADSLAAAGLAVGDTNAKGTASAAALQLIDVAVRLGVAEKPGSLPLGPYTAGDNSQVDYGLVCCADRLNPMPMTVKDRSKAEPPTTVITTANGLRVSLRARDAAFARSLGLRHDEIAALIDLVGEEAMSLLGLHLGDQPLPAAPKQALRRATTDVVRADDGTDMGSLRQFVVSALGLESNTDFSKAKPSCFPILPRWAKDIKKLSSPVLAALQAAAQEWNTGTRVPIDSGTGGGRWAMAKELSTSSLKSKYTGIKRVKAGRDKWFARISYECKVRHIGTYPAEVDAALAWDDVSSALRGHRAYMNFPLGVQSIEELKAFVGDTMPVPGGTVEEAKRLFLHHLSILAPGVQPASLGIPLPPAGPLPPLLDDIDDKHPAKRLKAAVAAAKAEAGLGPEPARPTAKPETAPQAASGPVVPPASAGTSKNDAAHIDDAGGVQTGLGEQEKLSATLPASEAGSRQSAPLSQAEGQAETAEGEADDVCAPQGVDADGVAWTALSLQEVAGGAELTFAKAASPRSIPELYHVRKLTALATRRAMVQSLHALGGSHSTSIATTAPRRGAQAASRLSLLEGARHPAAAHEKPQPIALGKQFTQDMPPTLATWLSAVLLLGDGGVVAGGRGHWLKMGPHVQHLHALAGAAGGGLLMPPAAGVLGDTDLSVHKYDFRFCVPVTVPPLLGLRGGKKRKPGAGDKSAGVDVAATDIDATTCVPHPDLVGVYCVGQGAAELVAARAQNPRAALAVEAGGCLPEDEGSAATCEFPQHRWVALSAPPKKSGKVRLGTPGSGAFLGAFEHDVDAAAAYDREAVRAAGLSAKVNFPCDWGLPPSAAARKVQKAKKQADGSRSLLSEEDEEEAGEEVSDAQGASRRLTQLKAQTLASRVPSADGRTSVSHQRGEPGTAPRGALRARSWYAGVTPVWIPDGDGHALRWSARILDAETQQVAQLGMFEKEEDAARAFDQEAYLRQPQAAKLNFPEEWGHSAVSRAVKKGAHTCSPAVARAIAAGEPCTSPRQQDAALDRGLDATCSFLRGCFPCVPPTQQHWTLRGVLRGAGGGWAAEVRLPRQLLGRGRGGDSVPLRLGLYAVARNAACVADFFTVAFLGPNDSAGLLNFPDLLPSHVAQLHSGCALPAQWIQSPTAIPECVPTAAVRRLALQRAAHLGLGSGVLLGPPPLPGITVPGPAPLGVEEEAAGDEVQAEGAPQAAAAVSSGDATEASHGGRKRSRGGEPMPTTPDSPSSAKQHGSDVRTDAPRRTTESSADASGAGVEPPTAQAPLPPPPLPSIPPGPAGPDTTLINSMAKAVLTALWPLRNAMASRRLVGTTLPLPAHNGMVDAHSATAVAAATAAGSALGPAGLVPGPAGAGAPLTSWLAAVEHPDTEHAPHAQARRPVQPLNHGGLGSTAPVGPLSALAVMAQCAAGTGGQTAETAIRHMHRQRKRQLEYAEACGMTPPSQPVKRTPRGMDVSGVVGCRGGAESTATRPALGTAAHVVEAVDGEGSEVLVEAPRLAAAAFSWPEQEPLPVAGLGWAHGAQARLALPRQGADCGAPRVRVRLAASAQGTRDDEAAPHGVLPLNPVSVEDGRAAVTPAGGGGLWDTWLAQPCGVPCSMAPSAGYAPHYIPSMVSAAPVLFARGAEVLPNALGSRDSAAHLRREAHAAASRLARLRLSRVGPPHNTGGPAPGPTGGAAVAAPVVSAPAVGGSYPGP